MTDFLAQLPDDIEIEIDLEQEPEDVDLGGGRGRFCKLTLFSLPVTPFVSGASFELPGVLDFDRTGLRQFKGMKPGGKAWYHVFVANSTKQDGEPIQIVRAFKGWKQNEQTDSEGNLTNSSVNEWKDLQWPHIKEMSTSDRVALNETGKKAMKDGIEVGFCFAFYREAETGLEGEYDSKQVLTEITVYKTEVEWADARNEFFAQIEGNEVAANTADYFQFLPDTWRVAERKEPGVFANFINDNWGNSEELMQSLDLKPSEDLMKAVAMVRNETGPVVTWSKEVKEFGDRT